MMTMTDNRMEDAEEEEHSVPSLMGMEVFAMMGVND
jgi:hypothetical protein